MKQGQREKQEPEEASELWSKGRGRSRSQRRPQSCGAPNTASRRQDGLQAHHS